VSDAYRFEEWLVEPDLNRLSREADSIRLEPLAMDVLVHLLSHQGRVVSPDEILDRIWPDRCGDVGRVKKRVAQIRRALDDDARRPLYIETISKRGYRAVATVTRLWPPSGGGVEIAPGHTESTAVTASIVVLPFVNLSDDPKDEYFSDGTVEEILNVLSKVPRLHVAGRTSSLSFKGRNPDVKEIARAFSVNHVLEGSVRRDGDGVRVRVQLIDAFGGFGKWSRSFDCALSCQRRLKIDPPWFENVGGDFTPP
jgi:TolB-like protein